MGIGISVFSLAKVITWLLVAHPVLVWSFFFGLVLASTWFVSKDIKEWNWKTIAGFVAGAIIAFYITIATPAETSAEWWFIFICGAIAICAMILPGISGSFILVLLGKYFFIMEAVKTLNIKVMLIFAAGAFIGITTFSRVLSYALKYFRNITLAVLTGFMLGSLNKVWPWKEKIETMADGHIIELESNILPSGQVWEAVALALIGFFSVYFWRNFLRRQAVDPLTVYKKRGDNRQQLDLHIGYHLFCNTVINKVYHCNQTATLHLLAKDVFCLYQIKSLYQQESSSQCREPGHPMQSLLHFEVNRSCHTCIGKSLHR